MHFKVFGANKTIWNPVKKSYLLIYLNEQHHQLNNNNNKNKQTKQKKTNKQETKTKVTTPSPPQFSVFGSSQISTMKLFHAQKSKKLR